MRIRFGDNNEKLWQKFSRVATTFDPHIIPRLIDEGNWKAGALGLESDQGTLSIDNINRAIFICHTTR